MMFDRTELYRQARQAERLAVGGIAHMATNRLGVGERAKFIRALYDTGHLDTMEVVARMFEDFGLVVSEAEVCRAVRRKGEVTQPYRRREMP